MMLGKILSLAVAVTILGAGEAWAWSSGSVDESATGSAKLKSSVDDCRGVYIIYLNRSLYYAGMSNVSVRERLIAHFSGRGSSMIADQLGKHNDLSYEWMCVDNPEQVESQLIKEIGTSNTGNLRQETDPADRWPEPEDPK